MCIEDVGNLRAFLISTAAMAPTGNVECVHAGRHTLG
jgi:enoyl-[acyl-carrier-protein] reductase (NADH)